MLHLIFAASSLADDFSMIIMGHMFGGCIGSVAVNLLVSVLLLCAKTFGIQRSARQSAGIRSALTWQR